MVSATRLIGLMALSMAATAAAVPLSEFEDLAVVPVSEVELVPVPRRRSYLSGIKFAALANRPICNINGMSAECQSILDRVPRADPSEETYAFGDGYYNEYEDIDENADVGVLNMPYQMDYDLLKSHLMTITGGPPCGGCDDPPAAAESAAAKPAVAPAAAIPPAPAKPAVAPAAVPPAVPAKPAAVAPAKPGAKRSASSMLSATAAGRRQRTTAKAARVQGASRLLAEALREAVDGWLSG